MLSICSAKFSRSTRNTPVLGIVLFFLGITGAVSWTAKVLGAESQLVDAAPGVVLFVVGLFVVLVTRYDVKTTQSSRRKK